MATRQVIKTGSTVDDGTGDLLRDAFVKVNTNFENVWEKTSVNSELDFTEYTVSSTGDLILSPAGDIKTTKQTVFNFNKGNFDLTVHGNSIDNVLFVDASTGRVGILNNAPTQALDVTGNVAISGNLVVAGNTTLNGNIIFGNASSDIITYVARVGSNIEPYGSNTIGSTSNRWTHGYYTNLDVTGTVTGNFTGTIDSGTTITNNINSTTIVGDTITATTSAEVGNLLVTGTLTVQGTTTTLETTDVIVQNQLTFEGATPDDFETTLTVTDPTADRTITFKDEDGTVALLSDITGAIALTDLSVTVAAAGSSTLAYNSGTGAFTFTPPDLSTYLTSYTVIESDVTSHQAALSVTESQISDLQSYLTSVPAQTFASLTSKPTTVAGYGITDSYANTDVDAHINVSGATANQLLKWTGTDYAWVTSTDSDTTYTAGTGLTLTGTEFSLTSAHFDGAFASLTSKPTTVAGYGITDAASSAQGALADSALQSVPAQTFASLTSKPTTITGYGITDGYANTDVDAHLNTSSATSGQVLSWNGSDYAWAADATGGATSINTAGNTGTGSVTFASETLTATGTTNQINVAASAFALSFSLDADLTGLTTINTHTIPSGTGTLALAATTIAGYGITDSPDSIDDISVAVPTSSAGQAGDVVGRIAQNATHFYYCTATHDGSTNIWKRVAWSADTW